MVQYHVVYHKEDNPVLNDSVEEWRDVEEFKGRYQVSNFGRVRSLQDHLGRKRHKMLAMHPSTTSYYLYVKLYAGGKMHNRSVHRLVAKAFVANPDGKPMVNHKDGNKRNNHASNLEWVTCSENHSHAVSNGLRSMEPLRQHHIGRKVGKSKFHNVSWDSSRKKWIGAIKVNGRTVGNKRFDCEVDAARHVNFLIDKYGLHERPKNAV